MSFYESLDTASFIAAETISKYDAVILKTADRNIYKADDVDSVGLIGFIQEDAVAGDCVSVGYNGVTKVNAGAAITRGAVVATNTSAAAITAASSSRSLGVALASAGGAGEVIPVLISIGNILA